MKKGRLLYWFVIATTIIVILFPADYEIKPLLFSIFPFCIFLDYHDWKVEKKEKNGGVV